MRRAPHAAPPRLQVGRRTWAVHRLQPKLCLLHIEAKHVFPATRGAKGQNSVAPSWFAGGQERASAMRSIPVALLPPPQQQQEPGTPLLACCAN